MGWRPAGLDAVFSYAATLSADTLVISTQGETVASFGELSKPYRTHSIRKALLSALVGRHVGPGPRQISLDATLQDLGISDAPIPLTDLQKQATVRHLLQSVSGVNHPAAAELGLTAEKDRLLGSGENQPGTIWAYNNWDYNALTTIFEQKTGLSVASAFRTGFADPLGMEDFSEADVSYRHEPERSQHRAAAFRLSARDLARFGQLYLDRGEAPGAQLLPASWPALITTDFARTARNDLRWGHGYLWWLPNPEAGLPEGTYFAWGLGAQAVFVIPEWSTVIVHQSETTEFLKRLIPALAAAEAEAAEAALEQLVLFCFQPENRRSDYCVEHRFTTPKEFDKLITLIVAARL
ncbi:MAG: beta-lactamase family protein [Rhodobacteraceae bacterium]|nr:beta-lactamase family protein [Paracoccaceae bacterium]